MRFLVDECLRARVAELLSDAGHDAVHVGVVGLLGRPDTEIMEFALRDDRVVISADTDFGELLARSQASLPSVILLRRNHDPGSQASAILAALPDISESLAVGSIVVITSDRLRVRDLPIN